MIIAFQSKTSPVLERYLNSFVNPQNIFMEMIHNIMFTEKKLTRLGNIIIIEQESVLNVFAKYASLPSVTLIILGIFFQYWRLAEVGAVLLLLSLIILSRHFTLLLMIIKLKISGHKEKIEMVSDGFIISKLLYEREHGKPGNTTIPKG